MKLKSILWYLGVAATAGLLILGIMWGNWLISVAAFGLALVLKATNKHIPLPKIYEKLGIKNETFEGKATK